MHWAPYAAVEWIPFASMHDLTDALCDVVYIRSRGPIQAVREDTQLGSDSVQRHLCDAHIPTGRHTRDSQPFPQGF